MTITTLARNTVFCDGKYGSDTNGGTSWDDAIRTVNKAVQVALPGMTVLLGEMHPTQRQPDVLVNKAIEIVGTGDRFYQRNPLQPLNPTSTMLACTVPGIVLRNLRINTSAHANFTGVGLAVNTGISVTVEDFVYVSLQDADANKTYGGTGIRHNGGEQATYNRIHITNATTAFHVPGPEGSCCTLRSFYPTQNYRDFVMGDGGGVGGWLIDGVKASNSGSPAEETDVWHFYPAAGNNTLLHCDLCEAGPNRVILDSNGNTLVNFISAPGTELHMGGDHNTLVGGHANGRPWVDHGVGNTFVGVKPTGAPV